MFNELFPPEVKILGHWRIVNMFLNKLLSSLKKKDNWNALWKKKIKMATRNQRTIAWSCEGKKKRRSKYEKLAGECTQAMNITPKFSLSFIEK